MISFDFGQTGLTNVVAVRFDNDGDVWNTDTSAFEAYDAGNIADYAIATAEVGDSGIYEFSDPASVNGRAVVCLQAGVSFAQTDLLAKLATLSIQYSTVADSVTGNVGGDVGGKVLGGGSGTITGIGTWGDVRRWKDATPADVSATNGYVQVILQRWKTDDANGTPGNLSSGNKAVPSNAIEVNGNATRAATFSTWLDYDRLDISTSTINDKVNLMAGAGFDSSTDSLEAIRNRGDTAWITADLSGVSTFDPETDAVFLTEEYDAAKNAAQPGDEMDLIDAPNATAVAAIQSGLSTFNAGEDQVTVETNNDKTGYGLANDAIKPATIEDGAFTGAKFASGAFDAVWTVGTRTLTSFGTLVTDITSAVWAAAQRTLTAFEFTPTPSNAADTTAIRLKTDQLVFSEPGRVDASAEFSLTEQNIQDIADGVVQDIEEQGMDISDQSLIEITNAVAAVRANVSKTPNRGGLLRLYIGDTYAQAIGTQIAWILDDAEGLVDLTGYTPLLSITVRGVTINSSNGVVSVATGNQRSGYVELLPSDYGDIQPGDGEYSIAFVGPGTPEVVTTQIDGLVIMRATPEAEVE